MLDVVLDVAFAIAGWFAAAIGIALVTGGMIHARDLHDRPAVRRPARALR